MQVPSRPVSLDPAAFGSKFGSIERRQPAVRNPRDVLASTAVDMDTCYCPVYGSLPRMSDDRGEPPAVWPGHPRYGAEHYEALGRFILRFAMTEIVVHMTFRYYSQMPIAEARLFFGKAHTRQLIDYTKQLMKLHNIDKGLREDYEELARQFLIIAKYRDAMVHREFNFLRREFQIYDIPFVKDINEASVIKISIEELKNMMTDLRSIDLRLRYYHVNKDPVETDYVWQYKSNR
jgi:hypothetical protein